MAIGKLRSGVSRRREQARNRRNRADRRRSLLETLEQRQLLAVGPQLIGIQPDGDAILTDGSVREVSPRELVFRFDENQRIHPDTLSGIRITRSGNDQTFGLPTATSDFGSAVRIEDASGSVTDLQGGADVQLTGLVPGRSVQVMAQRDDARSPGAAPRFTVSTTATRSNIAIAVAPNTTVRQLVDAINADAGVRAVLRAELKGGSADAIVMADPEEDSLGPILAVETGDEVIVPAYLATGEAPNQNEVVARFASALPDDHYQIEVFGFDDPNRGITGLRNMSASGSPGELLVPRVAGARQETLNFRLDLGAQVTAVVPQPVVREADGSLRQRRNEVVVYFNDDDLFVEYQRDANGNLTDQPTERSAENPRFYSLILTRDSINNRDDLEIAPTRVVYNPSADAATLIFGEDELGNPLPGEDLANLFGGEGGTGTFRLRVGTAEPIPLAPQRVGVDFEMGLPVGSTDLGTAGASALVLRAQGIGGRFSGLRVEFTDSGSGGPSASVSPDDPRRILVDLGAGASGAVTFEDVAEAINNAADVAALVEARVDGPATALVGGRGTAYAPVNLVEPGDTFETGSDLGTFGIQDGNVNFRSVIISGAIDPSGFQLQLPGSNQDPGHRTLPSEAGDGFEQHINERFGPDAVSGITTVPYNFQRFYGTDANNQVRENRITDRQRTRIREALDAWSRHLGIQFIETQDRGLTFATGDLSVLDSSDPNVFIPGGLKFGVRVDPDLASDPDSSNAMLVLEAVDWNDRYGEAYFRTAIAGIGSLLGLERAGDLPTSTLMALRSTFLNGTSGQEPVFPGAHDILHGQHLWRPESGDIDLYRFEVSLGDTDKVGLLTAETFAERLPEASSLDTSLTLFKQTQASALTDFGLGGNFQLHLEAVRPGILGNRTSLQFVVTPSGDDLEVTVDAADPNAIVVFMSNPSALTFQQLADALNADPEASQLLRAEVVVSEDEDGTGSQSLAGLAEDTPPVLLSGGGIEALTRNDDYFSEDSFLRAELSSGVYYIGVAASGNDRYDPTIPGSGSGGTTQGAYDLQLKFRPQVDVADVLRDLDGNEQVSVDQFRLPGTRLDGDADGVPGGVHNFWFQSRSLERRLVFTNGGDALTGRETLTVVDHTGITRRFQFIRSDATNQSPSSNHIRVGYDQDDTPGELAQKLATVIGSSVLKVRVAASADGTLTFRQPTAAEAAAGVGQERSIDLSPGFTGANVLGRTIFVDKTSGPQADGSPERPFNNISSASVANAFAATEAGDIVRIVGNGGDDLDPTTVGDNFAYEIGFGTVAGQVLEDGTAMEIPHDVTVMVDAGAVFKMRRSYIGVGSTNLLKDRSESVLQVLGTPKLLTANGDVATDASGRPVPGSVFFTSLLDESIGKDRIGPTTTPNSGDWGGILFRRDLDRAEGRSDLEDQGIFLQHVGHADIRYGGGKNVLIDSVQQVVNPIQIVDRRPTAVFNQITHSADAAISATPDSFEETNFQSSVFQAAGVFTADYDRVGPDLHGNRLEDNSLNGLFVRAETPAGGNLRELTVAGRFDDTDIVHVIAENVIVSGTPGGVRVSTLKPSVNLVTGQAFSGGQLPEGAYSYRVTLVDAFGNETLPSDVTQPVDVGPDEGTVVLAGLPPATGEFFIRRVYRSRSDGLFDLVGVLDASARTFRDTGETLSFQPLALDTNATERRMSRQDASLVVDPGAVVKLEGARIELEVGTQMLAEGAVGREIVFTSKLDDRFGAGGAFDTDNNGRALAPEAGNWGGIYVAAGAHLGLDHAVVAFGGGLTRIEGTFKSFSAVELQQGTARITNTVFQDNEDGQGGQGPTNRLGRLDNTPSTIFVRGSQPVIVGNTFLRNDGSLIDIDANSMTADLLPDVGRSSGPLDRLEGLDDNYGPLVRRNRIEGNELNAMEIRGRDERQIHERTGVTPSGVEINQGTRTITVAELTTESVWDDTDIVHAVFQSIEVGNFHSDGGLRLQSRSGESLVVKFSGIERTYNGKEIGPGSPFDDYYGTGLTATGTPSDIADRIGGMLHVMGRPGAPVVLTSLADDSVGAGLRPDGSPHTDTNNDRFATRPEPNDWRGLLLDQYSHDRNVAVVLEMEKPDATAPGPNSDTFNAEMIGDLAARPTASDENLRLGFKVNGFLSEPGDVDVYSFTGEAGVEVFLDLDQTTFAFDPVIELLDADGEVLARSRNSTDEAGDPSLLDVRGIDPQRVGSLAHGARGAQDHADFGSTNPRDAGLRVVLPGVEGSRSVYHVRVRSAAVDMEDIAGGLTSGAYQLQVRLQQGQEFPGSTVQYADIRYANHGVHVRGLPSHSPLLGEAQEDEQAAREDFEAANISNDRFTADPDTPGSRPQYLGNLLSTDRAVISVGGTLGDVSDVDFYRFHLDYKQLSAGGPLHFSTIFDIDYADGSSRPDTNLSIFYDADGATGPAAPQLVLFGQDSNVADDRRAPLSDDPAEDFARGSVGAGDPLIGSMEMPEGLYYVAVTESSRVPVELLTNFLVRREPVPSVDRVVDDQLDRVGGATANPPTVPQFIPRSGLPAGWSITNARGNEAGHGRLNSFDGSRTATGSSNQSLRFDPAGGSGSLTTNAFNLAGYTADDLPRLYFTYLLAPQGDDSVTVRVHSNENPTGAVVASTTGQGQGLTPNGGWRQAVIDLGQFAGHSGVQVEFDYSDGGTAGGEGLYLDDFIVGFAERGELITGANSGSDLFTASTSPSTITSGQYQLEIRPGVDYATSLPGGRLRLDRSFDTNARHADGVTLIAPAGNRLQDGDFFELGDGTNTLTFEFDDTTSAGAGSVQLGRIRVPYDPTMTAAEVAQQIIAAINQDGVQAVLDLEAASSGGIATGSTLGDARIHLFGSPTGDFREHVPQTISAAVESDAAVLAGQLVGDGIRLAGTPALTAGSQSAGTFSGGRDTVGIERGVVLSTGDVMNTLGPNLDDNASGTSSGAASAEVDGEFGASTSDHTALEFEFDFADTSGPQDVHLQLAFASEEYTEDGSLASRDIAAVFLYDETGNPVAVSREFSTGEFPSGSPEVTPNDPRDGGVMLNEFGFDGVTQVLRFSATDLDPALRYRARIVVADNGSDATDSAVFLKAGSFSTSPTAGSGSGAAAGDPNRVAAADGRVTFDAILSSGQADQNVRRDQGQVLIQNNFISDVAVYGVWTRHGEREQDPADFRGRSFFGFSSRLHPFVDQPALGPTHQGAVRNLRSLNDIVEGGLAPGLVISNNVIDQAGVAGVRTDGSTAPLMISPVPLQVDDGSTENPHLRHFGDFIPDGLVMIVDAGQNRVVFEFEDIAGGATSNNPPALGSGTAGGDGVTPGHIPIYYRQDQGSQYNTTRNTGYTQLEVVQAMRDAIIGSILVTNGDVQLVDPIVGPSLTFDSITRPVSTMGFPNPALFLEGVSNVFFTNQFAKSGGRPFRIEKAPVHEAPQPFVRVVNNTIYGADGRASETTQPGTAEPNDRLGAAIDTRQGRAHHPTAYQTIGVIGDSSSLPAIEDVDFYQYQASVGDRVLIDVGPNPNDPASQADVIVRVFNSRGEVVRESLSSASANQSLDFTVTEKGTYYVAISARGNDQFDPFSLAGRRSGVGTGTYQLTLEVLAPRQFVITAEDASQYQAGDTFTISQVPDLAGTSTNTRTFEFTFGGGVAAGNIPVRLTPEYRAWDVARAIAAAINGIPDINFFRTNNPPLPNHERGNGPDGTNGPITRVTATPLGGMSGDGVGLFNTGPRPHAHGGGPGDSRSRFYGVGGFGHDRLASGSAGLSDGAGTSELYVVVENAAKIDGNGAILLDPEPGMNYDQLLPETGIMVAQGASPTLLNNVIINTFSGIVDEVSRFGGFGPPEVRGLDRHHKPNEVIVGGNLFQSIDDRVPVLRNTFIDINGFRTGIEPSPSNVGADEDDFNTSVPETQQVLQNPAGDQFLPAAGSFVIDSSIDSLLERDAFAALKRAVGIAESPLLAPARDATGQLRSDDPSVSTPSGLGGNVFKDRGALDRADFVGPSAALLDPEDNDTAGRDQDPSLTVIRLADGTIRQFVVQLRDTADAADPFPGSGIDDDTVVGPMIDGVRQSGAAVTVFENGRLLEEGIDYSFRYNRSTDQVILTPLAGVWDPRKFYQIQINHRDRFVLRAPAGPQATDGSSFKIRTEDGGEVTLEFETGFQLRLPSDVILQVPSAGGGSGGAADGDRLTVTAPDGRRFTFEMDTNGVTLGTNTPIPFRTIDNQEEVAQAIVAAFEQAIASQNGFPVQSARLLDDGRIFLAATSGTTVGTGTSAITQPAASLGITVPFAGTGAGGVAEGETFTINDGAASVTFELVDENPPSGSNTPISITGVETAEELARAIRNAIVTTALSIQPQVVGRAIHLGLSPGGGATAAGPGLSVAGLSRPLADGDRFTLTDANSDPVRFEFNSDGALFDWAVQIPAGSADGDTLVIRDNSGTAVATFELDFNATLNGDPATTTAVPLTVGATQVEIAAALAAAIRTRASASAPVIGARADGSEVRLELAAGHAAEMTIAGQEQASQIPANRLVSVLLDPNETVDELTRRVAQLIASNTAIEGLQPRAAADGIVSIGGTAATGLSVDASSPLDVLGRPGVQPNQTLQIAGPLVLQMPANGGIGIPDGASFELTAGGQTRTFEFDIDTDGTLDNANAIRIAYSAMDPPDQISAAVAAAINASGLGVPAQEVVGARVEIEQLRVSDLKISGAPISARQGTVSDGERVTISDGTRSVTFEFENASGGGGVRTGNTAVLFSPTNSSEDVADALAAAIRSSRLSISASSTGNEVVLADTPRTRVDLSQSRTVGLSGVPGGAIPIPVINSGSFTAEDVKRAIIESIQDAFRRGVSNVQAVDRGADTLFVEGAVTISNEMDSYFLRAVQDRQNNPLKANQANDVTQFTVLLPGVEFDYGDAPDPVASVPGRYPTTAAAEGARHLIVEGGPILGSRIDAEPEGQPQRQARGDDQSLVVRSGLSAAGQDVFRVSDSPDGPRVRVLRAGRLAEGATLTVDNGLMTVTFVLDSDGQFDEDFIRIPFDPNAADPLAIEQSLLDVVRKSELRLAGVEAVSGLPAVANNTGTAVTLVADDEEGVTFGSEQLPTTVFTRIAYTDVQVGVSGTGYLDAWIDFNGDGDWTDPGEQIVGLPGTGTSNVWIDRNGNGALDAGEQVSRLRLSEDEGPVTLKVRVPATSPVPPAGSSVQSFARFRISEAGGLRPDGLALSGEVEDYAITIVGGTRPVAVADSFDGQEDTVLDVSAAGVLANDTQGPGLRVYAADVGTRTLAHGELNLRADGSFTFTPQANFFGQQTFTYRTVSQTLLDATGELLVSSPTTVTINVAAVNDPPRQANDLGNPNPSYAFDIAADEDTDLQLPIASILGSFTPSDPSDNFVPGPPNESNQSLSIGLVAGGATAQGGTVRIEGSEVIYRAAQDFTGTDQFVLQVLDSGTPGRSVDVTFNVTVSEANDAPLVQDKAVTVDEDSTLSVAAGGPNSLLTGATDPDGDDGALRVIGVNTDGTQGTVTLNADGRGGFTFVPTQDFAGTTQFRYTVRDEAGATTTATVSITVNQVPDSPSTLQPLGTMRLVEDGDSEFLDLTQFFTDADIPYGDSITFPSNLVSFDPAGVVSVTVSGPLLQVTPLTDAFTRPGEPVRVTVTARDTTGRTFSQDLLVEVEGVNDAPVVVSELPDRSVQEDTTLAPITLPNSFSDPDGDTLQFSVFLNSNPNLVTATVQGNQLLLQLVPDRPLSGSESATLVIQASDGSLTVTDQFQLTVTATPDAPVATDDSYTVAKGGVLTVEGTATGLLANDRDADGDAFSIVSFTQPSRGSVTVNGANGTFTYTNDSGNTGDTDQFTYTIEDATGRRDTATVRITLGTPLLSHQNQDRNVDVNGDGSTSPIDALLVINLLNRDGRNSIPVRELAPPAPYYDVNGSATVTPQDALLVINALNRTIRGGGEGEPAAEGEAVWPAPGELGGSIDAGLGAVPAAQPVTPMPARSLRIATPVEPQFDWAEDDELEALASVLAESEDDREATTDSIDSVIEELF